MINIFYTGDAPVLLCGIEFKKEKVAIVSETKLQELRKNNYFLSREKKFFKIIGEKKAIIREEIKENKEEVKEEEPKKTRKKVRKNANNG